MLNDIRYAVRLLGRSPGFAAAAIGTLALGIGATTAIFALFQAIVLKPLPIEDPGVLGSEIRVANTRATIVGITPRGFGGLKPSSPPDMFLPLAAASMMLPPGNYFDEVAGLGYLVSGLKDRAGTTSRGSGFMRGALGAAQVAISVVLIVGAGLFIRSLRTALATDVGTDVERLAYATVSIWGTGYDEARLTAFSRAVVEALSAVPGVERASFGAIPLVGFPGSTPAFGIDGVARQLPQTRTIHRRRALSALAAAGAAWEGPDDPSRGSRLLRTDDVLQRRDDRPGAVTQLESNRLPGQGSVSTGA